MDWRGEEIPWLPAKFREDGKHPKTQSDPHYGDRQQLRTTRSTSGEDLGRSPSTGNLLTINPTSRPFLTPSESPFRSVFDDVSGGGLSRTMSTSDTSQATLTTGIPLTTGTGAHPPHLHPATERTRLPTKSQNSEWEVDMSEVEVGKRIGAGSFGVVYRGYWYAPVAVKVLNVDHPTQAQV